MSSKKSFSDEKEEDDNPFTKPSVKQKIVDKASFRYYIKTVFGNFQRGIDSRYYALAGKKIHVRLLRSSKRVLATGYFLLFLVLAFVPSNSIFFFFFFLGGAFLMLDYLWKSRKVVWEKPKK